MFQIRKTLGNDVSSKIRWVSLLQVIRAFDVLRIHCIMCGAQCKMKTQGFWFQNSKEQDFELRDNHRAGQQARDPSEYEPGALPCVMLKPAWLSKSRKEAQTKVTLRP